MKMSLSIHKKANTPKESQMGRNQGFENSLRCLQHPLSLLSIAVLLLNDHVLKIINPSWVTGKLSDFAGLFFFPFVVAAVLSLLFAKFNLASQHIGKFAFGFVAVWFFLLKTSPVINFLTVQFSSLLVGLPTYFILDWTDIIGLTAMIPAWKLWNQNNKLNLNNLRYIALTVGALAAIATSPTEWAVASVTDLHFSQEGILYAADRENYGETSYPIAKSADGGLTWERDSGKDNLPEIEKKIYPVQVCHNLNRYGETCYRVTSSRQFEFENTSWMKVFSDGLTVRAYDIIIFEWEEKHYILVAIGESGVLRRELPDGIWEIVPVINARSW